MTQVQLRRPATAATPQIFEPPTPVIAVLALFITLVGVGSAQTVTNVYNFSATGASQDPIYVTPIQGRDGELYGTTYGLTYGSVFKITTNGSGGDFYAFDGTGGANPVGGLTLSSDGNYYGTTAFGGSTNQGVLFRITPGGAYTVLHEFTGGADGAAPFAPPILASDGNLYGTTEGELVTASTIYKVTPSGSYSVIYQFDQANGATVDGALTQGTNGNLYGAAAGGGAYNCGTLFRITTSGRLLSAYSFACGVSGATPVGDLIQASDGNFYGMTDIGGTQNLGTIFKMNQLGTKVTILHSFAGNSGDGKLPTGGLVQATDGNLYGTADGGGSSGYGVLFRVTTTGNYAVLYSFGGSVGQYPAAAPFQDTNGLLYGTTNLGGANGYGAVYSVNIGLKPFITFVRPSGGVGQTAQILGQSLKGTTSVTFNGVPATSFRAVSNTYLTAVVPSGATTGSVVLTTPGGKLTSNKNFRIIGGTASAARAKPAAAKKAN